MSSVHHRAMHIQTAFTNEEHATCRALHQTRITRATTPLRQDSSRSSILCCCTSLTAAALVVGGDTVLTVRPRLRRRHHTPSDKVAMNWRRNLLRFTPALAAASSNVFFSCRLIAIETYTVFLSRFTTSAYQSSSLVIVTITLSPTANDGSAVRTRVVSSSVTTPASTSPSTIGFTVATKL